MSSAYLVAAYRTPGCKANKGAFSQTRPDDLAAAVMKGTIEKAKIDPGTIDDVILGCAFPEGEQGMNVARVASFKAGIPYQVPAVTINRFCSSGLQSISFAADRIMAGNADCILAGGVESMSLVPMGGNKYSANPDLVKAWPETYSGMGITAELVAEKYGIEREAMDQFALASHQKAIQAQKDGRFDEEILPVEIELAHLEGLKMKKETKTISHDDGPREDSNLESLAKLKPVFKQNGTVTAGNSSQMTDGAAAVLVVSEAYLKKHQLTPIARLAGYAVTGCKPEIMGIGPVVAVPKVLERAGMKLKDIQLVELNEAFAAQSLAVIKELGLDPKILNVNGGAIALGHPLGCSGAKLTATLLNEMKRRDLKFGMVTMCIGGGMGAAGIFERM